MTVVDEVRAVLLSLRGVYDGREPIDELTHALQCAGHALADARDDELVVACLLHDIARSPLVLDDDPRHEQVAARWLRPRFGACVGWLAGAHVAAKQHLVAHDPSYALSEESRRSLAAQALEPPDPALVGDPRWPDALDLRRYDDRAKVPGAPAPDLDHVLDVVRRVGSAVHAGPSSPPPQPRRSGHPRG